MTNRLLIDVLVLVIFYQFHVEITSGLRILIWFEMRHSKRPRDLRDQSAERARTPLIGQVWLSPTVIGQGSGTKILGNDARTFMNFSQNQNLFPIYFLHTKYFLLPVQETSSHCPSAHLICMQFCTGPPAGWTTKAFIQSLSRLYQYQEREYSPLHQFV